MEGIRKQKKSGRSLRCRYREHFGAHAKLLAKLLEAQMEAELGQR